MSIEFDSSAEEQLAPHVEAWYELGLGETYEHIEPNSALGGIAVALHEAVSDGLDKKSSLDRRYRSELDLIVHADEIEAADYALDLARSRDRVFHGMYFDIENTMQSAEEGYEDTVEGALKRGIDELDGVWMPPGSKSELIRFNQEIAAFLLWESHLHFRTLEQR